MSIPKFIEIETSTGSILNVNANFIAFISECYTKNAETAVTLVNGDTIYSKTSYIYLFEELQ